MNRPLLTKMNISFQNDTQCVKIWRPPFCGGPVAMAPMVPVDKLALYRFMSPRVDPGIFCGRGANLKKLEKITLAGVGRAEN